MAKRREPLEAVTLEGELVRLEPLSLEHHAASCEVGLDPELWRWSSVRADSPEAMRAYIEDALEEWREGRALPFATIERRSGRVVGSTRFGNVELGHGRVEIGWTWVARAYQRTGINVEAKLLMLRHAFEKLGCARVEFKAHALNERSRRAILALGAKEEGTLRSHMVVADGTRRDTVDYSIRDSEGPDVRRHLEARLARRAGGRGVGGRGKAGGEGGAGGKGRRMWWRRGR